MGRRLKFDLTGQRFGRLSVTSYSGGGRWLCRCDCGASTTIYGHDLRREFTTSCGCHRKEVAKEQGASLYARRGFNKGNTKHGLSRTSEYTSWNCAKLRCDDPTTRSYKDYGGRGIAVCERWRTSFEAFLADMGRKPSPKHTLDRLDPNGNYEPGNCRWATKTQQATENRRPKS